MTMTLKAANAIAGSLGAPSKMPGTSYGISAHACITGVKLAQVPGSVCHGCYALKANYQYPSVQIAHARRLEGLSHPQWVDAMVTLIEHSRAPFHRWHDSGDIQSVEHLAKICAVAERTKRVKHWLPTREHSMVQDYVAAGGIVPANLVIRVSATMVDGSATNKWQQTSRVHSDEALVPKGTRVCPAPKQGNVCGACRACWSPKVACVSYHQH